MGWLEYFKSPRQEKDERARREARREAEEGSDLGNVLNDLSDGLKEGSDYLNRKIPYREGIKEAKRGDSSFDNLTSDIHDEFVHGPEYVARKQYSRNSSSADLSSNYGGGGGGGGGSDAGGFRALLLGIAVIVIIISYIHHVWKQKHDANASIGTAKLQVSVRSEDIESPGVLKFAHGQPQTLDMSVNLDYTVYYSERSVQLTLLHDGAVLYSQVWKHGDMAFIFPLGVEIRRVFPVGDYLIRATV